MENRGGSGSGISDLGDRRNKGVPSAVVKASAAFRKPLQVVASGIARQGILAPRGSGESLPIGLPDWPFWVPADFLTPLYRTKPWLVGRNSVPCAGRSRERQ